MPIAEIQLPNGKIAELEVPEGATNEQILSFAKTQFGDMEQAKPQEQQMSRGEALARTTYQGATMGFGDEILAAGRALGAKALGGDESFRDYYNLAKEEERGQLQQARQEYPVQSVVSEIGASIPTGGRILKAAYLTGMKMPTLLKGGAALGVISGLGETENIADVPETIKDTTLGGVYGATAAGAFGLAGQGIGKAYSKGKELLKKVPAEEKAVNILGKYINPEEATQAAAKLEATTGRQTILPDIASDEVQGLTRLLGKTTGSKNIIADVIGKRTTGSNRRVANLINNKVSSEAYFGNLDEISKARKEIASPLYKQAYKEGNDALNKAVSAGGSRVGTIDELIGDDRVVNLINKARQDYGIGKEISDVSIEALHGARQVADDVIGAAQRAGENNKARSYIDLKSKINNVLYQAAPTLEEADNTFAGYSALKNAQEEGLDFTKLRPEQLKTSLKGKTAGEKDAFKIGVREGLMKQVEGTPDMQSAARKIWSKPENRDRLKIVFNNPKEYSSFAKQMNDEIRIFDTKQRILGGSRTDINLADEQQIIDKVAGGVLSPKTSLVKNTIDAVASSIKKKYIGLDEKSARELATVLTNKEKSIDALRKIASKSESPEVANQFLMDVMPKIIGGYVGGLDQSGSMDAQAAEPTREDMIQMLKERYQREAPFYKPDDEELGRLVDRELLKPKK